MKRRIICLFLASIMATSLTACKKSLSGSTENLADTYKKESTEEISISTEEKTEFEKNYADFAVEILKNTAESGENIMISPLSLLTALTMTENGAAEETLSQMEQVLANGISLEKQNHGLGDFISKLQDTEKSHLNQANSIWFCKEDESFQVNEEFLQQNVKLYDADIYGAPFNEETLDDINEWVSNETDGMVKKVLDEIPKDAIMYLINAVAFEAEWSVTYKSSQIRDAEFYHEDGTSEKVSMMYSEEGWYFEDGNTTGFIKPYEGEYSFVVFLPAEGIEMEQYLADFSGEKWMQLMAAASKKTRVKAGIPKFTSEYEVEMADVLSDMGMPLAFDETQADFSKIGSCGNDNIYISAVIHKTYVSVDELGTKAGASTVVEMAKETAMLQEEVKEVILNRPFVYAIIENDTKLPIFIGVTNQVTGG